MTDITINDVTTGTLEGTGVFDKLMQIVKVHLTDEYDNGRLKGPEYAQVYVSAIQAVLAQSIEFALREKLTEVQIDSALKDIELKEVQKQSAYVDRIIKDKEAASLGLDNVVKQREESRKTEAGYVYVPAYME